MTRITPAVSGRHPFLLQSDFTIQIDDDRLDVDSVTSLTDNVLSAYFSLTEQRIILRVKVPCASNCIVDLISDLAEMSVLTEMVVMITNSFRFIGRKGELVHHEVSVDRSPQVLGASPESVVLIHEIGFWFKDVAMEMEPIMAEEAIPAPVFFGPRLAINND